MLKIKHIVTFLAAFSLAGGVAGAQVRFTYGLEWGYTATMFNIHSFNYHTTDGVRVDDTDALFDYRSNAMILGNAGAYFGDKFSATLNSGYASIYEKRMVCPLTLRATFFPKGYLNEGMKFFADGGTAFPMDGSFKNKAIYLFKAGGGYRIPIYGRFGMDLSLAAQYTVDHPVEIIDKYTHRYLDLENVRRSDRDYFALSLTLALYF